MSDYSALKATINANIKANNNHEITGAITNSVLNAMVDSLGAGYQFMGVATPTNPGSAQTPDYKCFYLATTPGTYTNLGGLVVADGEVALLKYDTSWTKEVTGVATAAQVNQLGQEVNDLDRDLVTGHYSLVSAQISSTGQITFAPIVLSQDGDELEIEAMPDFNDTILDDNGYPFTFGATETKICIGLTKVYTCFRADDNSWVFGDKYIGDATPKSVRFKYINGNIEFYGGGILRETFTGQKALTIYGIGSQQMSSYGKWTGTIYKFNYTHNGVTTGLINLPGFTANEGVTLNLSHTDGRVPALEAKTADLNPNFFIKSTSSQVKVYCKINGNNYVWFGINHIVNHSDSDYVDYWRIGGSLIAETGGFSTYNNGTFIDTGKHPLSSPENEFAIQFYSGDFTGGYHGDERIDLDANCYVVFIIDGKEYSIADLVALGDVACSTFAYREKSALYSLYAETSAHDIIAYHTKRTIFNKGGFITRNYVAMASALTAKTVYSALFCVHKDCSQYAINDAGDTLTFTHPESIQVLSSDANKADRDIKMYKGDLSCIMTSRVVGGNVAAYNNAPVWISIDDRAYDGKYYSELPQNVSLASNSVFELEGTIQFDYKADAD